jgi:hypothetical protein
VWRLQQRLLQRCHVCQPGFQGYGRDPARFGETTNNAVTKKLQFVSVMDQLSQHNDTRLVRR